VRELDSRTPESAELNSATNGFGSVTPEPTDAIGAPLVRELDSRTPESAELNSATNGFGSVTPEPTGYLILVTTGRYVLSSGL
jgi:hypothetical protein